ncbi:MAG: hypothetical protein AAGD10_21725 [Myxococcota bacterium]
MSLGRSLGPPLLAALIGTAGFLVAPKEGRAEGVVIDPGITALFLTGVTTGTALNVLGFVAQAQRRPDRRVKPGWHAIQYVAAGIDIGLGMFFVTRDIEFQGKLALTTPLFVTGSTLLGLAIANSVQAKRIKDRPELRIRHVGTSPRFLPAARALPGGGFVAGVHFRF